jgi:hypothetical protein
MRFKQSKVLKTNDNKVTMVKVKGAVKRSVLGMKYLWA